MVTATQIQLGDKVVSADGKELGVVTEIGANSFKVGRRFRADYWLGTEYVDHVAGGIVQMTLTSEVMSAAKVEPPAGAS